MGTIKKGILGGFSGKVGNVVGSSWKGISYMRSLAQSVKNPRTEAQLKQRGKFALVLSVLKPMTDFIRIGWKQQANKQSAFNAATAHTLANAVSGTYPDYEIDLSKVLVSKGTLTMPANGNATLNAGNITITWDDNSTSGSAKTTDKTLIVVLNPDKAATTHDDSTCNCQLYHWSLFL